MNQAISFYRDKKVLITGHTGFKGSWLSAMLASAGAKVIGYSKDEGKIIPSSVLRNKITHIIGDVRDLDKLKKIFAEYQPELVFHLAAQPIVRQSYVDPVETYSTNIMGTVNVLECVRLTESVKSVIIVTTDKVYENKEWYYGYRETDPLGGFDPYSNSKACAEMVTSCYKNLNKHAKISTVRAGNVIGGGDLISKDRIIPDLIKAAILHEPVELRNPYSLRPYQHVLEPLYVYLLIARLQYYNDEYCGAYNIGPDEDDCISTLSLTNLFNEEWGDGAKPPKVQNNTLMPLETNVLKLDNAKLKSTLFWLPTWDIKTAVKKTVEWTKAWMTGVDPYLLMTSQFDEFLEDFEDQWKE